MHVLLIHNPGSGGEDHDRDALVARLELIGHDVEYRSTEESEWFDALSAKPDLFAVAGGDGTVNRVFKELTGSSTPMTVYPARHANRHRRHARSRRRVGRRADRGLARLRARACSTSARRARSGARGNSSRRQVRAARRALPVRRRAGRARGQGAARARVAPRLRSRSREPIDGNSSSTAPICPASSSASRQ